MKPHSRMENGMIHSQFMNWILKTFQGSPDIEGYFPSHFSPLHPGKLLLRNDIGCCTGRLEEEGGLSGIAFSAFP